MNRRHVVPDTLPLEIRRLVAAAREGFEKAWRLSGRPAIEPDLEGLGPVERTAVLHELVALDIKMRSEQGDCPTIEEYVKRFPGDAAVVASAYASSMTTVADHALSDGDAPGPP